MAFNELNSVGHYIINQLSGVNLNSEAIQEPKSDYGSTWVFKAADEIERGVNEVIA